MVLNNDVVWLGPGPANESCAQIGDADFEERNKAECRAYITAIKKKLGDPPEGVTLKLKAERHEYGIYFEAVCEFDPTNQTAVEWAYHAEDNAPCTWAEVGLTAPVVTTPRRGR